MKARPALLVALLIGAALGLALSTATNVMAERPGVAVASAAPTPPVQAISWEDARLLAEVLQRVRENYVDEVDDHRLMRQAAHGLVESLDEYSSFLDSDEYEELKLSTQGSYAGIGIEVATADHGINIVHCIPGSPAEKAGLRADDLIVGIDGQSIIDKDLDAAIGDMRGAPGTSVKLDIKRAGKTMQFEVQRTQVELQSVNAQLLAPGYGYIRVSSFSDVTPQEFAVALATLTPDTTPLKGMIIDLRNNPGGVLDAAVKMADDLLDKGTIVSAQGRTDMARFVTTAAPGDVAAGTEIALLVNGGSASAAEILAAALQENGRATLVGRKTYGKGVVQTIMPLSGGQALKLTTSRYFTPKGTSINRRGITPDVEISGAEQPPADMDIAGKSPTLAGRDTAVGIALQTLRGKVRLAQASNGPPRS